MKAADTNILLRIITGDDPEQEQTARAYLVQQPLRSTITVTVECEWVLRSYYKFSSSAIEAAFSALMALDGFNFEHAEGVRWALSRMLEGADFADMIHLVAAQNARSEAFVTFDRSIERKANDSPALVETLR